ncbi:hypothetical protein F5I97DRAFT_1866386 [Phlebopus sp. FC_14]|nr:hypothetical protein F5I97DRAFT_1866386 [Phlebopus sp. FC_14]
MSANKVSTSTSSGDPKLVVVYFVERSTGVMVQVKSNDTLQTVRETVHRKAKAQVANHWTSSGRPDSTKYLHPDPSSIQFASAQHGFNHFIDKQDDARQIGQIYDDEDPIVAIAHSPLSAPIDGDAIYRPYMLQSPLNDQTNRQRQLDVEAIQEMIRGAIKTERVAFEKARERDLAKFEKTVGKFEKRLQQAHDARVQAEQARAQADGARVQAEKARDRAEQARERVDQARDRADQARAKDRIKFEEMLRKETMERQRLEIDVSAVRKELASVKSENHNLQAHLADASRWLVSKDTEALDRVRLRHMLTVAQENLALATSVATSRYDASILWRRALGPSEELSDRLKKAHSLLNQQHVQLDERAQAFVKSGPGMKLVVEARSTIRALGDNVAHPPQISRDVFHVAVARHPEFEGMQAIENFVCD